MIDDVEQMKQMAVEFNNTASVAFEEGRRFERRKPKNIDTSIGNFLDLLDFEALEDWCSLLGINYNPQSDPDWEDDLRVEIGEAMKRVGEKK